MGLTVAAALTTLIVGVAAFLPAARLWGVNHLAFYPTWVRVLALVLVALTFVPAVANRVYAAIVSVPVSLRAPSRGTRRAIVIIVAATAGVVFWHAQASTNLLGDGQLISQSYEAAARGDQTPVMRSIPAIVRFDPISKGATILYYGASKVGREWFGLTATDGIRLFVCLIGALTAWIVLTIVQNGTGSRHVDAWLLFLALFSCATQLFFGYVEMYPPLVLVLVLYVVAAIMAAHRRVSAWLPTILFVAAVTTHIQAILFLPSLIYLLWWLNARRRHRHLPEKFGVPVLVGATIGGAVIARFFTRLEEYFLPLFGNEETYGILSPAHIADVVNELMMILPIAPVVVALIWASRTHPETARDEALKSNWLSTTVEWQFILIGFFSCVVYLVGFHPEIGFARDWDLFMMIAVVLIPLTLLALNRYIQRVQPDQNTVARFGAPVIVLSIVFSMSWIGVNASKARSMARFEQILAYDMTHASYAYENLAILHHSDGRYDDAVRVMETCVEISPNPRLQTRLAIYYGDAGRREEGLALLYDILERRPGFEKARIALIEWLERAGRWDLMLGAARGGLEHFPNDSRYVFYYGEALIRNGNVDEGIVWLRKALTLNPPDRALAHIQKRLREYGQD